MRCDGKTVTYRWRDSKTQRSATRTVAGAQFLRLVWQHVLPKGLRRARNFGFLHPDSKRLIAVRKLWVFKQAREFAKFGHTVRLMAPKFVAP